ncbi:MAG: copper resistance protein CopC [Schumannella sp.]|nr:copper resistance protein CopC [Microbacteriaceae bacterium]
MSARPIATASGLLAAGALTLTLCAAPLVAAPASAHNVVISTTPTAGETLTELPEAFQIVTNEPLLSLESSKGFVLQIRDAHGLYYGDGCLRVEGATMSAEPALGAPGDYTVLWQAVSEDGHTIDGEIPFSWAPTGEFEPAIGYDTPPVCGEERPSPEPTQTQVATPAPDVPEEPAAASDLQPVLWIGGGVLVLAAVAAIVIGIGRARR